MDHMVTLLEDHNRTLEDQVAERTELLKEEKRLTETLLFGMLPM